MQVNKEHTYNKGAMNNTVEPTTLDVWHFLLDNHIANEREMILVTKINGYKVETLNDILFARTGYNDIEQYAQEEL